MNYEELAIKYIDRTISPDEMSELLLHLDSQPGFKEDFELLNKIDSSLEDSKYELDSSDMKFLGVVGMGFSDKVANFTSSTGSVASGNVASVSGSVASSSIAGIVGSIGAKFAVSALVVATLATGSYFYYNNSLVKNPEPVTHKIESTSNYLNSTKPQEIQIQETQKSKNEDVDYDLMSNSISSAGKAMAIAKQTPPIENQVKSSNSQNLNAEGSINEKANAGIKATLINLEKELKEKQNSEDIVGQATLNKKIGLIYKSLSNNDRNALIYLENAYKLSSSANMPELKAECLGELGLLDIKIGNKETGLKKIEECLNIMKDINPKKHSDWINRKSKLN
ncbi:MAG: hypothetical protein NTW25_08530 [Candidatus Kapabacteria bacterium]|nr:hypothetical protein [Candidatus Kapabacteria bacterium]